MDPFAENPPAICLANVERFGTPAAGFMVDLAQGQGRLQGWNEFGAL